MFTKEELAMLKKNSIEFFTSSGWNNLYIKLASIDNRYSTNGDGNINDDNIQEIDDTWSCNFCTLINSGDDIDCEACGLPHRP